MIIQHNMLSNFTNRQLGINSTNKSKSTEKLSSGYRINKAADDAAGLSISEKMRAQIRGLDQANRNAQDGISLLQTADGALGETHSILQRMGQLSVQAATDTYTYEDRQEINEEFNKLKKEINRISSETEFNTRSIFLDDTLAVAGTPGDIKIYSNAAGTYGGIIYDNTRYDWSQIKTADGAYSLADASIKEGTYYLNTVDGSTLSFTMEENATIPYISKQYYVNADNAGIKIDNKSYSWNALIDESAQAIDINSPHVGTYTLNHYGSVIQIYVEDGDNQEDIKRKFNNSSELSTSWDSQLQGIGLQKAVFDVTSSDVPVNNGNKDNIHAGSYSIHADAAGIQIDGYQSIAWSDLEFVPADSNGETKGVDFNTGKGIGVGTTVTFECQDTGITFDFRISDEASLDSVIKGLNNVTIPTSLEIPVHADLTLAAPAGKTVMNSFAINDTSDLSITYETQRDKIGLDFDNGLPTAAASLSDFKIGFTAGAEYSLSSTEVDKLTSFFESGTSNSIQLAFSDPSYGTIKIDFAKNNNTSDSVRPTLGSYATPEEYQTAMDTYTSGLVADFKDQLAASGFSLQSEGVTMEVSSFSEQSTSLGNQVNVPVFGIKPDLDNAYRTYNIQAGANTEQSIGLKISKLSTTRLNIVNTDLTSHETAGKAITIIYDSIERISKERSSIGAYQNRLEHTLQNSSNTSENLQNAESRIRDVNMAVEMVKFSEHNILEQASQAMLTQANQSPQGVLNLLQ